MGLGPYGSWLLYWVHSGDRKQRSSESCPSCVGKAHHSQGSQPQLGSIGCGLLIRGTQVKSEQAKDPTIGQSETNLQQESLGSER